jgi:anti-anti-sigma regulatory factor
VHTEPTHSTAIAVAVSPETATAYVRIVGDISATEDAVLAAALERLDRMTGARAYIDLGEVTAVSTALLVFVARVATMIAPCATALCRPTAIMRRFIDLAGLDAITTLRDDLPQTWIGGGTVYA